MKPSQFRAGDYVSVKSFADIQATLDDDGRLDGVPFMPEMAQYCGQVLVVDKVGHKTCDPVYRTNGRHLDNAVHLQGARCDGSAHGNCDADCNLFWKDEWLEPSQSSVVSEIPVSADPGLDLDPLIAVSAKGDGFFSCQATELINFSSQLNWWNVRQYFLDWRTGNESIKEMLRFGLLRSLRVLISKGFATTLFISLHQFVQRFLGGLPYSFKLGGVSDDQRTPREDTNLQPGDWVRVKSYDQILETLDRNHHNRGMRFDIEAVPFCGGTFRVRKRVENILDEKSGKLFSLKTPGIILDNVYCMSRYSNKRMFCPRRIPPYWREIWLEKVAGPESIITTDQRSEG